MDKTVGILLFRSLVFLLIACPSTLFFSSISIAVQSNQSQRCHKLIDAYCPTFLKGIDKASCVRKSIKVIPDFCRSHQRKMMMGLAKKPRAAYRHSKANKSVKSLQLKRNYSKRLEKVKVASLSKLSRLSNSYKKQYSRAKYMDRESNQILLFLFAFVSFLYGVSFWKIFEKAGFHGWKALIPLVNIVTLLKISRKPVWWLPFFFVPIINLFIGLSICIGLAKRFSFSSLYGLGLMILGPFMWLHLGFSDAQAYPSGYGVFSYPPY